MSCVVCLTYSIVKTCIDLRVPAQPGRYARPIAEAEEIYLVHLVNSSCANRRFFQDEVALSLHLAVESSNAI